MRRWPLQCLRLLRGRYGSRFTVRIVDVPPLVFLSDPQEVSAVFAADPDVLRPGAGTFTLAPILGGKSFMARDGDAHMAVRSALAPAFQRGAESEHSASIAGAAREEILSWPLEEPVALHRGLLRLTLSVIAAVTLGTQQPETAQVKRRMLQMLSVTSSLVLLEPRLRHLPGWHGKWQRLESERTVVAELLLAIVARRRREGSGEGDVLDVLLRAERSDGSELTDAEIVDDLLSLLLAGHETTASVLAWAFQLLAQNPGVQDRLIASIDRGDDDYLNATVLETLRHAPVFVFAIPRPVAAPIEIGGFTYHPPVLLMPCLYLMHHDPDLYPEPYAFRPERFLGEGPQASGWAPWGGGRRRCLGQHLATLEIAGVLRELLSRRTLHPAGRRGGPARWRTAILAPGDGSRVRLRMRP